MFRIALFILLLVLKCADVFELKHPRLQIVLPWWAIRQGLLSALTTLYIKLQGVEESFL